MIKESTLQQIEARANEPIVQWQTVHADICLLLAEVRALQQPPAPGEMLITRDEWRALSAQTRLNLRKWEMQFEEIGKALDRGLALADEQGVKLARIENWCKAYPLDVFPEPDFTLVRQLLEAGGVTLDAVSASNMRHVVEGIARIINEGSQS